MRYLLMIYEEPPASPLAKADWDATMGEYNGFTSWLKETGQYLGGEALHPVTAATTVSIRDGRRLVTDGPFAETKEHLGGYYLIESADLDAAIEAAGRMPGVRTGRIEIRPILELG